MAQSSFDALRHFMSIGMRMSHIYQPLMLKTMLERGGSASSRQIATAFLNEVVGQTVAHCRMHLIPRRPADVLNPRGGVRSVIPGAGDYSAS